MKTPLLFKFWIVAIFATAFLLVFLVAFSKPNTICPQCQKRKRFSDWGWKMLCEKCK